jgi:4-amino-4-deoxy-L-arabinose transferase-like glycosyltransferase
VAVLVALAALVRASVMFTGSLSGDDATVGLVAKHVLSGENFPVFFYGQTYMGTLNGIHLVPALYLFGPSALVVRLNAIAWSLLFPLGMYLLGRRIFDEPTGRATLALVALPPFLLTYWSTVAEPHHETNVFGVWLLLLALAALTTRSDAARVRAILVLGLLSGLATWTSPKAIVVLGPVLALLLLRSPRLLLGRGGALLAGGFVLGSLPAWLFYATHGDASAGSSTSVRPFLRVGLDFTLPHLREFSSRVILDLLGTYHWHPDTAIRRAGLALNCLIYVLGVAFALDQLVRSRRDRAPTARAWGLGLLLLTLAASLGSIYLSSHAERYLAHAGRYALPAYLALFACAGALVARASRRSRALGTGLLAFLLFFAAWTHAGFFWPLSPAMRAHESAARSARDEIVRRLDARPVEALYVEDSKGALVLAFLLDRPTVSAVARETYVPQAVAADAADRIAILAAKDVKRIADDLAAVGATWKATPIRGWRLLENVRVPERAYRMVPRREWQVTGDARVPTSVADGDLFTAWPLPGPDGRADPLVLDLGQARSIARVIFWPSGPTSGIFPLRVSGSTDGRGWETLGAVPANARQPTFVASGRPVFRPRNGWLELALTPRPLRYVRLEPAEDVGTAPWGVAELQVYEATGEAPPGRVNVDALVERLRGQGVGRLLADPVASARVDMATRGAVSTLIANGVVDNHGTSPLELLAPPVRLGPSDALLVPTEDLPELRQRLEAAGARYMAEPLGSHALLRIAAPLASTAPCRPAPGSVTTREPRGGGIAPRVTVEASLRHDTLVSGVRLRHAPGPASELPLVEAAVSRDGQVWQPASGVHPIPGWGWAGRTLFAASDGLMEVSLDPIPARHIRVVITSPVGETHLACVHGTPLASR